MTNLKAYIAGISTSGLLLACALLLLSVVGATTAFHGSRPGATSEATPDLVVRDKAEVRRPSVPLVKPVATPKARVAARRPRRPAGSTAGRRPRPAARAVIPQTPRRRSTPIRVTDRRTPIRTPVRRPPPVQTPTAQVPAPQPAQPRPTASPAPPTRPVPPVVLLPVPQAPALADTVSDVLDLLTNSTGLRLP